MNLENVLIVSFILLLLCYSLRVFSNSFQQVTAPILKRLIFRSATSVPEAGLVGSILGFISHSAHQIHLVGLASVNAGVLTFTQASALMMGSHAGAAMFAAVLFIPYSIAVLSVGLIGLLLYLFFSRGTVHFWGRTFFALAFFVFLQRWLQYYPNFQIADLGLLLILLLVLGIGFRSALYPVILAAFLFQAETTLTAKAMAVVIANIAPLFSLVPGLITSRKIVRRVFLVQVLFKLLGSVALVALLKVLVDLGIKGLSVSEQFIVLHIVANVVPVFLLLPLLSKLETWSLNIVPEGVKESQKLVYLGFLSELPPALSTGLLQHEIDKFTVLAFRQIEMLQACLTKNLREIADFEQIYKYEHISDNVRTEFYQFSEKVMQSRLTAGQACSVRVNLRMADELEKLMDIVMLIAKDLEQCPNLKWTTLCSIPHLEVMVKKTLNLFEQLFPLITEGELVLWDFGQTAAEVRTLYSPLRKNIAEYVRAENPSPEISQLIISLAERLPRFFELVLNLAELKAEL